MNARNIFFSITIYFFETLLIHILLDVLIKPPQLLWLDLSRIMKNQQWQTDNFVNKRPFILTDSGGNVKIL